MCVEGVINVSLLESFVYVINGSSLKSYMVQSVNVLLSKRLPSFCAQVFIETGFSSRFKKKKWIGEHATETYLEFYETSMMEHLRKNS